MKMDRKKQANLKVHLLRNVRSNRQRHDRTLHPTLLGYQHTLQMLLSFILISLYVSNMSKGDLTFLT